MTSFVETKDIWKNEFGFCTVSFKQVSKKQNREKKKISKKGKITNWCPFLQNN